MAPSRRGRSRPGAAHAVDRGGLARHHLGTPRGGHAAGTLAAYELGATRALGPSAHVSAQLFSESTRDALLTVFEDGAPFVRNAGTLSAQGFGVTVGRRFGGVVDGSVTYTFGQGRHAGPAARRRRADDRVRRGRVPRRRREGRDLHRLVRHARRGAFRLNALTDSSAASGAGSRAAATSTRFDVQLTQGLPFLAPLTRADWELLLAVRNMFYEASQAGFLDELAVQDPPTRVVGGSPFGSRRRSRRRRSVPLGRLERASIFCAHAGIQIVGFRFGRVDSRTSSGEEGLADERLEGRDRTPVQARGLL